MTSTLLPDGPAPQIVFAEAGPGSAVTVTYDLPIQFGPSPDLSAFLVRFAGFFWEVGSIDVFAGNVRQLNLVNPTGSTLEETIDYQPPPNSIQSLTGTPAQSQLGITIE